MKEGNRKVDEQAREVISNILLFDVSDPRLEMVTVTGCKVSYDRAYCDIYFTCQPDRYPEVQAALASARGHIRSLMAKKLDWKQAPELRFHVDETVDAADKLGRYINAEKERQATFEAAADDGEEF